MPRIKCHAHFGLAGSFFPDSGIVMSDQTLGELLEGTFALVLHVFCAEEDLGFYADT